MLRLWITAFSTFNLLIPIWYFQAIGAFDRIKLIFRYRRPLLGFTLFVYNHEDFPMGENPRYQPSDFQPSDFGMDLGMTYEMGPEPDLKILSKPGASNNALVKTDVSEGTALVLRMSGQTAESFYQQGEQAYLKFQSSGHRQHLAAAIQQLRKALEVDRDYWSAEVLLVMALLDNGSVGLNDAIEQLEHLLHFSPEATEGGHRKRTTQSSKALLYLGYCYKRRHDGLVQQMGPFPAGTSTTYNVSHDLQKSTQALCKALSLAPWNLPKARLTLASNLVQQAKLTGEVLSNRSLSLMAQGMGQCLLGCATLPLDGVATRQLTEALWRDVQINLLLTAHQVTQMLGLNKQGRKLMEWSSRLMPAEPIFFQTLADDYLKHQNTDAAIYFYLRALEINDQDCPTQKKLAQAYLDHDDKRNALQCLEKVARLNPGDTEVFYDLANLYAGEQEYMRALYYFKEAARHFTQNPYIHSNMAYVLFKLEDYPGAIEEYRLAINYGEDALWTATVAQTLGTIYFQLMDDKEQALECLLLAHELDPSNLECMIMLAEIYYEENQLQDALSLYESIVELDPKNPECHNYIGFLLWQMDRNDEAIQSYEKAIALDPHNPTALNNLGVIYLDEDYNPTRALTLFEQALACKPDYTLAAFNLGRTREWLGDRTEAAKAYAQAQKLNEASPDMSDDEIKERINQLFTL